MDYPKLRNINIFPVKSSGQVFVCLQDPQNVSEKALFLPLSLYFIVSLFDGKHSILDIQVEYMRRFGDFLFREKIEEIINQLEENLFLEGERFKKALEEKEEIFKKSPLREAQFAGKSYEKEANDLKLQLEGYFKNLNSEPKKDEYNSYGLKGIIAPHIDFLRGGQCYAFAYDEMLRRNSSRYFIIFGTSHSFMESPFCLTRKDFVTPLGVLPVDQELVDAIQSRYPYDLFKDEVAHRSEHSIEFQCIFLRYLYPEPIPLKIIPILNGSLHDFIERGVSPMEADAINKFVMAIKDSVISLKRDICYIASADLSHMGIQFGDPQGIGEYDLRIIREEDLSMLNYVELIDGESFFSMVMKEKDRRRICGLSAIYTMLKVIDAKKGKLLKYDQAYTPETHSVVSFASLAFYG